jgi:hypothetical protein
MGIGNILLLIVYVALAAVLVSGKNKTAGVVTSLGNAFSNSIKAAKS